MDKKRLKLLFEMFPMPILKEIAYKKEAVIKTRSKEELVKKFLELEWTEKEIETYNNFLKELFQEKKPISYYLAKIKSVDIDNLKKKLEKSKAIIGEVNGRNTIINNGYEILEYEEKKILRAREWKKDFRRYIGPFGQIIEEPVIKRYEFSIDLDENMLYLIDCNFMVAKSLKNSLELLGVELEGVGLQEVARKEANKKFQDFVNDLELKLEEIDKNARNNKKSAT